jgi:prolyl-tRNA editing enzyme YbaK/EbsC (Cys-tRNA(Pro) deacylase)
VSAWPEPVERVAATLRSAGVEARVEEFAEPTPTARDAARAVGCDLSQIVKSLVFVCDGAYVLALVPGDGRADEGLLAAAVPAEHVRVARASEVVEATGYEPGGVAPFPHRAVSRVLIDRSLLGHHEVWIGAGSESHMAAIPPVELVRVSGAAAVDLVARR